MDCLPAEMKAAIEDYLLVKDLLQLSLASRETRDDVLARNSQKIALTKELTRQRSKAYKYSIDTNLDRFTSVDGSIKDLLEKGGFNYDPQNSSAQNVFKYSMSLDKTQQLLKERPPSRGDVLELIVTDFGFYSNEFRFYYDGQGWIEEVNYNIPAQFAFPEFPLQYYSDILTNREINITDLPKQEILANITQLDKDSFRSFYYVNRIKYTVVVDCFDIEAESIIELFNKATSADYIIRRLSEPSKNKERSPDVTRLDFSSLYPSLFNIKLDLDSNFDASDDIYTTILIDLFTNPPSLEQE